LNQGKGGVGGEKHICNKVRLREENIKVKVNK
jgi:hypothetical protein